MIFLLASSYCYIVILLAIAVTAASYQLSPSAKKELEDFVAFKRAMLSYAYDLERPFATRLKIKVGRTAQHHGAHPLRFRLYLPVQDRPASAFKLCTSQKGICSFAVLRKPFFRGHTHLLF